MYANISIKICGYIKTVLGSSQSKVEARNVTRVIRAIEHISRDVGAVDAISAQAFHFHLVMNPEVRRLQVRSGRFRRATENNTSNSFCLQYCLHLVTFSIHFTMVADTMVNAGANVYVLVKHQSRHLVTIQSQHQLLAAQHFQYSYTHTKPFDLQPNLVAFRGVYKRRRSI